MRSKKIFVIILCSILLFGCSKKEEITQSGQTWYSGTNYIEGNGNIGDFFFDTDDYDIYQKLEDGWSLISNIKGEDGKDGKTPTIEISNDGYWVINGNVTDIKTTGKDGENGESGKDGITPTITINKEGYWVINDKTTSVKASGENGINGVNGNDGKNGKDGASWLTGIQISGTSSNISMIISGSKVGDLYFNTNTASVYECISQNTWKYIITLKENTNSNVDMISNTVDLVMFMGQSNMAGRGVASESVVVQNGHGYEFKAVSDPTKLYPVVEPFGVKENRGVITETSKTGSLVSSFIESYYEYTGIPIVGVSASKGGTSISWWQPNGQALNEAITRYTSAKDYLTNNGYEIRHQYMVWLQGETDGDNSMSKATYKEQLTNMVNEMINQGIEKVMLIRIGNHRDNATIYDNIIQAQTEIAKENEDIVLISTKLASMAEDGLMKDTFHYKQAGYNIVGKDAGKNMAYYVNNGLEPYFYDTEYKNYYPFGTSANSSSANTGGNSNNNDGNTNIENSDTIIVDVSSNEYDFSKVGTVSNGKVTVPAGSSAKYIELKNPITLSPNSNWTIEIVAGNIGTDGSAAVIINAGESTGGFISIPWNYSDVGTHAGFRLRDINKTAQFDFRLPSGYDQTKKHHFAVTYDATTKTIKGYIDKELLNVVNTIGTTSSFQNTTMKYILGGYPTNNLNFKGDFYFLKFTNKVLETSEMYSIN